MCLIYGDTHAQDIEQPKEHLKASGVREKLYHSKMLDESEGVIISQKSRL